jgi:hypothetical protein
MARRSTRETALTGAVLFTLTALAGCVPPAQRYHRSQKPAPCSAPVAPIRNIAMLAVINVNYTYTPKDAEGGRSGHKEDVLEQLNTLGNPDGNSFAEPNGQQPNFYFTYSISNDGQDHYTGSLELSGWGQGHITTLGKYQYPYSSSTRLVSDLTDEAYQFVHLGWHDSRPTCPQS